MNRRSVLRSSALVLPTFVGGCLSVESSQPSTVTVSEIVVRNRLGREIDVSVLLTDANDVAYWQTVTVPSSPNPFVTLANLPESPGMYRLYAQVPATAEDTPVDVDLVEDSGEVSCITVTMEVTTVDTGGGEVPTVAYGSVGECRDDR